MHAMLAALVGVSVAAGAGLRAGLALLAIGVLARYGGLELGASYQFLTGLPALLIFGFAALVEVLGDLTLAVDHALDSAGTILRPIAGAILAAAVLAKSNPTLSTSLALLLGGGTALLVHCAKASLRAETSAFAPLHAGCGNASLSLLEDVAVVLGMLAVWRAPVVAAVGGALAVLGAAGTLIHCRRAGVQLWRWLTWGRWSRPETEGRA